MGTQLDSEIEALINYAFESARIRRSAEMGAAQQAIELAISRCKEAGVPLTDRQSMIIKGAILNSLLWAGREE